MKLERQHRGLRAGTWDRRDMNVALLRRLACAAALVLVGCAVDDTERVERAREHLEAGEARAAAIELKNVLRSDPSNVDARILLGRVALEAGDPGSAAKEFQKAGELGGDIDDYAVPLARAWLRLDQPDAVLEFDADRLSGPSQRADLAMLRGYAWLRKGEVGQARDSFQSALTARPEHPEALVGMASVMLDDGDARGAEMALRRVIAATPELAAAHAVLGRLQLASARYAEAEASFQTAVEKSAGAELRRERLGHLGGLVDALLAQNKSGRAQDTAALMLDLAPEHPYALFQAARSDFEAGNLDAVINRAQQLIATYPDYQPARMLLAAAALSKENYALAETHLRSLANADPGNADFRKLLAQTRMELGSPQQALEALQPLLDSGSVDPRLLAMAGSASLRSGHRETGLELLARGAAAGSADFDVQLQAAASMIQADEPERALALLEALPGDVADERRDLLTVRALIDAGQQERARTRAVDLVTQRPADPGAHRILAGFHFEVGETDAARRAYEKGLALAPGNEVLLADLVRLELASDRPEVARGLLEQHLRDAPASLMALSGLARIAEREGAIDRAISYLETARDRLPDGFEAPLLLSAYYLQQGRNALALERAGEAVDRAPTEPRALTALGTAQLESGRHSEALGTLERALQYGPNAVPAMFQMARAQLRLGLEDAATVSLRATLEREPDHLGARVALARMQGLRGDYTGALASAQRLKEQFPRRAEPLVLEGDIHIMRGHFSDAIEAYDRAGERIANATVTIKRFDARRRAGRADSHRVLEEWLTRRPDDLATRVVLAQAYASNGLRDKAIAEYQRVLDRNPDNVVALNNLAWIYAEAGGADNLARGIEIARRAHERRPADGAIADTYGWLLLQRGDVEQATRVLREAMRDAPDNPDIRYHLAVALHRGGAAQEARDLLDALLSRDENFMSRDEARDLRQRL